MSNQIDSTPVARLDFVAQGAGEPGWYVRYVIDGRPRSERLQIEVGADAFGAVELAADHLGCSADEIEFSGHAWPMPLDGMVDADQTLEFVPDLIPGITDHEGDWRLLGDSDLGSPDAVQQSETRRYERRDVEGVLLYAPIYGRVMNWSEAGMGIEIARPLRLETRDLFVAKGKRSKIELFGEVRWCRRIDSQGLDETPSYRAGITLIA